ncbi:hypothetical protein ACRAWD_16120 [Caulobacter segnis]
MLQKPPAGRRDQHQRPGARDRGRPWWRSATAIRTWSRPLSLMRALRELQRGYGDQANKSGPPLMMRWGLFQSGHAKAAEQAYLDSLAAYPAAPLAAASRALHAGPRPGAAQGL